MAAAPVPIPVLPQRRAGRVGECQVWPVLRVGRGTPPAQWAVRHPLVRDWASEPVSPPPAVLTGRSLGLTVPPTAAALPLPVATLMKGYPDPGMRTGQMRGWWGCYTAPAGPDVRRPGRVALPAFPLRVPGAGPACRSGPVWLPAMARRQHQSWSRPPAHRSTERSEGAMMPSRQAVPVPVPARDWVCRLWREWSSGARAQMPEDLPFPMWAHHRWAVALVLMARQLWHRWRHCWC